ncbi:nickel-dependent hydrogenase large subunit [Haloarcula halophila]|uniref:nickel-dependent hydrogenase large subunit n=1 Tax=Haloarcula TaxID=2237 RepID=UPI0023E37E91|nr:nickel-dependent hydrogenase large subunit [Halomicroarcula sp. DFY41]
MPEIEIDPTTRIEGHHSTTLTVEDGTVTRVESEMNMFRGIENIVLDRQPSDVPQVTQMVCGVCFTCHRQASLLAIEDAARRAGVFDEVPEQGRLLRDIMEGMFLLWNHTIHLFALAGPDYSDAVADSGFDRLDPVEGAGYERALEQQRALLQAFSEFGGRAPHPLTYAPGGVTADPDDATVETVRETVEAVSDWLGPAEELRPALTAARDRGPVPDHAEGLYDMCSILVGAAEAGADDFGVGPGRFYANGLFYGTGDESLVLSPGVYRDGELHRPTREELIAGITEDVSHAWYSDDSGGSPADAPPPAPQPEKDGAYSWGKAPRYEGQSMETGPLARLIAAERDPGSLRAEMGGDPRKSSTFNRLAARLQEVLLVREHLLEWLDVLDTSAPTTADWTDDFSGRGVGFWGASRGALSHWVEIEDGRVTGYQIVTPTTWNLGPRDADGEPSVFETAAEGITVDDVADPIDVMRTVRSFDPCLGCGVHVHGPEETFETEIEPHAPGGSR